MHNSTQFDIIIMFEIIWLLIFAIWVHFKVVDPAIRKKLGEKYDIKIFWLTGPLKKKINGLVNPSTGYYHWIFITPTKRSGLFELKIHFFCLATTIIGLFLLMGLVLGVNIIILKNQFELFNIHYGLLLNSVLTFVTLVASVTVLRRRFTRWGSIFNLCESINEDEFEEESDW